MTLKYVLYGLCFGWLLMPRWRGRGFRAPLPVMEYALALIAALFISYFFDYHETAWIFVLGMSIQLVLFSAAKWVRYFAVRLSRRNKD